MTYALGIDVGTSKIAVAAVDRKNRRLIQAVSFLHQAELSGPAEQAEQDVPRIMLAIERTVLALPAAVRSAVSAIGVTGQMHGVVLWNTRSGDTSTLITWQDQRCNSGNFLEDLAGRTGNRGLKSGFGCASLAWLVQHAPERIKAFDCAATIHDYLVCQLCELKGAITDPTDAASWGYYRLRDGIWDRESAKTAGIPEGLLPDIQPSASTAGTLCRRFASQWQLRAGIPVSVAIGDNQASLLATLESPAQDVGLTLGTGGQLAVIVSDIAPYAEHMPASAEIRPYVGGQHAAVAASLCGGAAYRWLPETIEAWCRELGLTCPGREDLYSRLVALGVESTGGNLEVAPHFIGERHDSSLRGTIHGVDLHNFSLGNISRALALGTVSNLKHMLPASMLQSRSRIVGSGNAIRKSLLMQECIKQVFGLPLVLSSAEEEAAQGAAILCDVN